MSVVFFITLWGCQPELSPKESIIEALKKDPEYAKQLALEITDPLQRTFIITEITEQFPHRTKILCDTLPSSVSKERCLRINDRPHLWKAQQNVLDIDLPSFEKINTNCNLDPHPNTCYTALAEELVLKDTPQAFSVCGQIQENKWQAECFFLLSEVLSVTPNRYPSAIEACNYATQYAKACWHHSVLELAQQSRKHWNDWQWHEAQSQLIADVFAKNDYAISALKENLTFDLQSQFWGQSIHWHVSEGTLELTDPPPIALPHIRNSMASQALRLSNQNIQNLEEWATNKGLFNEQHTKPRGFDAQIDLWEDRSIPENCRRISYLGHSHRISCDDSHLDWLLAYLESSARLRPINTVFIQEGLQHSNPVVQQTAQRLSEIDLKAPPDKR